MRPTNVLLFLMLVLLVAAPAAAQTAQVQVIRYASDGTTVANQTTVDVDWMQSNLPVFGDGVTPYLFQGPLTEITNYSDPAKWNPAEDNNVGKVNETIKGTYVTDLCNLVGGMQPGGVIKVVASDGYAKTFAYDNVYSPQARQGPMVLAWWTAREGYGYQEGIRLFFGADTSTNPFGLHVFGNQDMKETFDEKYWGWYGGKDALPSAAQLSNKWVAKVEIYPAPSTDWSILLNGSIKREITKSYFESGLAWSGHRTNYTDASGGVWEGMPLWRLVGYVDDGNEHSDLAFNRTLAEQGYTIRVIAADGYSRTFTSQEVAFSSNYIVANTLNGTPLPVQINGKNVWPLKLIGVNATGGKSVANITEIRVEGVPEATPTPTVSVTPTPTPTTIQSWTLKLSGYTDYTVTSDYFYQGMACGGHTGTYTDASGTTWDGMPLWRLVGLVDDQLGHEVLIGAFNDTLADQGYLVRVIAADGFNRTFSSQEVAHSANYLVAAKMNGSALPEQVNGKYYWPLKLVGANATGGKSVANITEIRLENLPITPPPITDQPWTLKMTGYTNFTVTSDYFNQGIACGHSETYTDTNNVEWAGMPLWRLVGLVDDQVGHEDLTGAFNDTLADQGYNITVIAGDGFSKTFTSQDVKRSANYLVASKMNGSALPEQVNGKYYWPLKLVGANATGGKSVANITEIRLDNLPIAPAPTTPTPTPTQGTGPAVLFDGDLTLKDGTFPCYAYNSGATQQVQNLTPNGALELASKAGGFGYNATDKKWVTMGTMLLDGAGGYSLDSTANRAWAYRVNGVVKNDFSSTEGISVYRIADGDLVEFYYGTKGGAFENAVAVIRARVHVREQATVFDGNVTLLNGTFGAYAYNSGATIPVNNLTVHGALETSAGKGEFTYNATDKKWSTMGTFLLDGVSTFGFNKTENTAWAYTLNGVAMNDYSADQGISVQPVKNGDQLVFYFGVKGAGLEAATAVVRIRVFVANDADFTLALKGARNATVAKAEFDASPDRVTYTDVSGTWSGVPLWRLAALVDDSDAATFNDVLAAANYTVRVTAVDGYNKSLGSVQVARSGDFIIADRLNGAPLPETMWPLRLVGAAVPPHLSVAKVAEIGLLGLPEEPPVVGGDVGYFLVSTTPSGADISFDGVLKGNTTSGPLNVSVYITTAPYMNITANLTGYADGVFAIVQYPKKGETVPVDLVLEPLGNVTPTVTVTPETEGPYNGPHVPSTRIEAEHFDTGGEGVACHDLEPANLGNNNMRAGEGVDVETDAGVTDVAFIRAGEYLKYSVDTTIAGDFVLALRAANPDTTAKAVKVFLDGVPAGEVLIGGTGDWTTYREFASAGPLTIPVGRHVVTLAFEGVNRLNLDWLSLSAGTVPTTTTTTAAPTPQTVPFGPGNNIPGRVQAENFDRSGAGAAYSDTTAVNEGGAYRTSEPVDIEYTAGEASYNIGWIRTGEWLIYTVNVANDGQYTASFRAANPDPSSKAIDVYVDGTKAGTAQIGTTGSFGTFRTFTFPVALSAGTHQLRLAFQSQRLNLNYVEFAPGTVTQPTVTTTTTAAPSGSATFTAAPLSAPKGAAVKFALTAAAGKTVRAAWWTFDSVGHYSTWNSRDISPTFFYPAAGTYTPLVKITYTDGSTETIERANYVTAR